MMNLYTLAGAHFGRSLVGRGQSENQEALIVRNHAVLPLACFGQPREKSLPRTLSERGVVDRVINLIQVFAEPVMKLRERPGLRVL